MGVSRGAGPKGGVLAPSDYFLPIPDASLSPLHHNTIQVGLWGAGVLLGCRGGFPSLSPCDHLHLNFISHLRHSHYLLSCYTYI